MNHIERVKPHWSFWAIVILLLVWNLMGVANFIWQLMPGALESFPPSHRAIIEGRPLWATLGFALAVFGGSVGCLVLLLRKGPAVVIFAVSLFGVMIAMAHSVFIVKSLTAMTVTDSVLTVVLPLLIAAFLLWYAHSARKKRWIA